MLRRFLTLALCCASPLAAQSNPVPPLPDPSGWGTHVLTAAQDSQGTLWVGTYGQGIYRLARGATAWERIAADTAPGGISWDFVQALAFGPRGQVWYGTVGNGWGLSLDGGRTWRNWTFDQLGPEWQYVAPGGIATHGDTTLVATADGIQVTTDDGEHWTALVDRTGPRARGPADTAHAVLPDEYVRRIGRDRRGWVVATLGGVVRLVRGPAGWEAQPLGATGFRPHASVVVRGTALRGGPCGLRTVADTAPCLAAAARGAAASAPPAALRTTWFRRPIERPGNVHIDQTYRYGSTMGGNFQQHQGVEFNNPDGTPVHAIGSGEVVWAGPAEQGALTVAIRHDSVLATGAGRFRIYSVYYHNSTLAVSRGERVETGRVIAEVGHTGRATNDHLHLEVHAVPFDSAGAARVVDPAQRFPPFTTNPELWIAPLEGTGVVAGRVLDAAGRPVPQARIYGIVKPDPAETPFAFAETYGDRAHPHPAYGEHFAVGDVPVGSYVIGAEIGGRRVYRRIRVEPGRLTWIELRP